MEPPVPIIEQPGLPVGTAFAVHVDDLITWMCVACPTCNEVVEVPLEGAMRRSRILVDDRLTAFGHEFISRAQQHLAEECRFLSHLARH